MKWSFPIATFHGIHVKVHITFFLILFWVAAADISAGGSYADALASTGFILALFGCVVLHEFGHALTAAHYGIRTRDITLLPIGGVARLERMPEDPRQELPVALAGPAVNLVIAAVLFLVIRASGDLPAARTIDFVEGTFLVRLLSVNVALVLFNMLPAFPMDGGRVLRALLALKFDYTRATTVAATLGQAVAFVFGFLGFLGNPFLIVIAIFVWMGAASEQSLAQLKGVFHGIPVRAAMVTEFHTLTPDDTLGTAVDLLLSGTQTDFPVVDDEGHLVGMLMRQSLTDSLGEHGRDFPVEPVMYRGVETIDASQMLSGVIENLQQSSMGTRPVVQRGKLIGLLTMQNIGEYVSVTTALKKREKQAE